MKDIGWVSEDTNVPTQSIVGSSPSTSKKKNNASHAEKEQKIFVPFDYSSASVPCKKKKHI